MLVWIDQWGRGIHCTWPICFVRVYLCPWHIWHSWRSRNWSNTGWSTGVRTQSAYSSPVQADPRSPATTPDSHWNLQMQSDTLKYIHKCTSSHYHGGKRQTHLVCCPAPNAPAQLKCPLQSIAAVEIKVKCKNEWKVSIHSIIFRSAHVASNFVHPFFFAMLSIITITFTWCICRVSTRMPPLSSIKQSE